MKRLLTFLAVFACASPWCHPRSADGNRPGVEAGLIAWRVMAGFLPDSLGGFAAIAAARGGLWYEDGVNVSWASRKYGPPPGLDGLEVTVLDTRGAGFALAEFHRLRANREKSETKTVDPVELGGCPAVQVSYHREQKAEVLILAGKRLLVHIIASGLGGDREPEAIGAAWRELDLRGLARLTAGQASKND